MGEMGEMGEGEMGEGEMGKGEMGEGETGEMDEMGVMIDARYRGALSGTKRGFVFLVIVRSI